MVIFVEHRCLVYLKQSQLLSAQNINMVTFIYALLVEAQAALLPLVAQPPVFPKKTHTHGAHEKTKLFPQNKAPPANLLEPSRGEWLKIFEGRFLTFCETHQHKHDLNMVKHRNLCRSLKTPSLKVAGGGGGKILQGEDPQRS